MKNTYIKIISFLKSLLGFTLFNCFLLYLASPIIGAVVLRGFLSSLHYNDVLLKILKEPDVFDAEILYTKGHPFWPESAAIRILYNNGGSLEIDRVNEHGEGNIRIDYVDDYCIVCSVKEGENFFRNRDLELWSKITGVQLKNITDCVVNYPIISKYVEEAPNIHKYRNDYEIEKLSAGVSINLEREINSEVIKRLLSENKFNFVLIGGQEYYIYKWPLYRLKDSNGHAHVNTPE
jgi:hypothetical protein